MDRSLYIAIGIVTLIVLIKIIGLGSFKRRTLKVAMEALRQNMSSVPDDSEEYFPSVGEMKLTLAHNYELIDIKSSIRKYYPKPTPELAAYHLLDHLERLFAQASKQHMAVWCTEARKSLESHVEKGMGGSA